MVRDHGEILGFTCNWTLIHTRAVVKSGLFVIAHESNAAVRIRGLFENSRIGALVLDSRSVKEAHVETFLMVIIIVKLKFKNVLDTRYGPKLSSSGQLPSLLMQPVPQCPTSSDPHNYYTDIGASSPEANSS